MTVKITRTKYNAFGRNEGYIVQADGRLEFSFLSVDNLIPPNGL